MKMHILKIREGIIEKVVYKKIFFIAIIFSILGTFFTTLHFIEIHVPNITLWGFWLFSTVLVLLSCFNKRSIKLPKRKQLFIFVIVTSIYWISHLWNFSTAPWNTYGLFDDAAWDIYFAKNHIFVAPFQAAFFDIVGYISREVIFHYYIIFFFELFGYSLLIFNIALLFLGYITVLFTTLLIHKIFHNLLITLLSFFVINFFPFHYMHIFMGHRYAIAAPLMMVSLYFLYTGFKNNSYFSVLLSALFAFFCWGSSVMGKQYLFGLFLAGVLYLFLKKISRPQFELITVWVMGFIIFSIPLLLYVLFNYEHYSIREANLLKDFLTMGVTPYAQLLFDLFFAHINYRRQFLFDFLLIPLMYYGLLLPGIVIAFFKKQYVFILLGLIPIIGAFFSGAYDFRVLLAVPIWVILMAFSMDYAIHSVGKKNSYLKFGAGIFCVIIVCLGLLPSVAYIWDVSKNPNHMYLLSHKDVAVSRLVQDIVAGESNPSIKMKKNEFKRMLNDNLKYDTFVSPHSSYAVMHLFLQDFNDKKILAFNNQGIQLLQDPEEILKNNRGAIVSYKPQGKDLKLIWENSEKVKSIIPIFNRTEFGVREEMFKGVIDGSTFSLTVLTIPHEQIENVQKYLKGMDI